MACFFREDQWCARIRNIKSRWRVAEVEINEQAEEVVVRVEHDGAALRHALAPSGYLRVPHDPGRADASGAV